MTLPLTTSVKEAIFGTTNCCHKAQVSAAEKPNPSTKDGTTTRSEAKI
ncbi:MAG: hypothetical protein WCJ45_03335 [bacterium]